MQEDPMSHEQQQNSTPLSMDETVNHGMETDDVTANEVSEGE